jgi:hypothetical protein
MTEIEPSSGNVYADLQIEDANAMSLKATLVSRLDARPECLRYGSAGGPTASSDPSEAGSAGR